MSNARAPGSVVAPGVRRRCMVARCGRGGASKHPPGDVTSLTLAGQASWRGANGVGVPGRYRVWRVEGDSIPGISPWWRKPPGTFRFHII